MRGVLLLASCVLASLVVVSHATTIVKRRNMIPTIIKLVANAECTGAGEPFPNPEDCGSFLQCEAAGVAAVQQCPAGLQFNAELKVCDYPWSANCSEDDSSSSDSSSSEEGDDSSSSEESDEADKKVATLKKPKAAVKKPNVIPIRA